MKKKLEKYLTEDRSSAKYFLKQYSVIQMELEDMFKEIKADAPNRMTLIKLVKVERAAKILKMKWKNFFLIWQEG